MSDSKSYKQILVENLEGVVFEVQATQLSGSSSPSWQKRWPKGSDESELYSMPVGLKITLKTKDMGDISRVFALGSSASGNNSRRGDSSRNNNRGGQRDNDNDGGREDPPRSDGRSDR